MLLEIDKLLAPDEQLINQGKERQKAMWHNKKADYIPILISGKLPERDKYPTYNMKEQFFDKEKMWVEQLWSLIAQARGQSDAQLCLRANLGVGLVPTIFGLEQLVFADKMPWLKGHLSKEELVNFEFPDDVSQAGLMPRAIEYINFFREKLSGRAHVFVSDTQGPFDIAHLVRGDEIFTDFYDDPDFVHHLLRLATRAYIECTKAMKAASGEELSSGYHSSNLYMGRGGVRVCEDTSTLLSPSCLREFVVPYLQEALQPFGGGWVHFCGHNPHLLDLVIDTDGVRGINLGNPERYDYEKVMMKLLARGKFYYGGWPKSKEESWREHFERMLHPLKEVGKGLIFVPSGGDEEEGPEPGRLLDLWRSLHYS